MSIGTTPTPTGVKLAVEGKILCEEVEVQLSQDWPDFVFEEGYELMPLDKVEKFIQLKKHLPDVPSAAEVESRGVSVGQMQATLLKKVEELTLHMIAIEKEVTTLRRENQSLRQRIVRSVDR